MSELAQYATLDQAMPLLTAFLNPVLGAKDIGAWQAQTQKWASAGE